MALTAKQLGQKRQRKAARRSARRRAIATYKRQQLSLARSNPAQYIGYLPNVEQRFRRCLALGETAHYKSVAGTGSFLAYYNLGALYHAFGESAAARRCFERAAGFGYEPARRMLATLASQAGPAHE